MHNTIIVKSEITLLYMFFFSGYLPKWSNLNSLSGLWEIIQAAPDVFRQIFTCVGQKKLIAADLRAMTEVEYSPKGHNLRLLEEDTMYSWEILLQNCEGNSLLFPVVAHMLNRIDVFFQYSDIE